MKKLIPIILIMALCLCGCTNSDIAEAPELIMPADVSHEVERITRHDVCDVVSYETKVIPKLREYCFNPGGRFGGFLVHEGDHVCEGTEMAYLGDAEKSYEDMKKSLSEMKKSHSDDLTERDLEIKLKKLEGEDTARLELLYEQAKELYELDESEMTRKVNSAKKTAGNGVITADIEGTIVALAGIYENAAVTENDSIILVAGEGENLVRIDFVSRDDYEKAYDKYVTVEGKRYEISYLSDPDIPDRLIKGDGSRFYSYLKIDTDENLLGKSATVMIIPERHENVLAVSRSALSREGEKYYVYPQNENGSAGEKKEVEIGVMGTMYAEVISGLNEGDSVFVDNSVINAAEGKTQIVLKSTNALVIGKADISVRFPETKGISLSSEYGEVIFEKMLVATGDYVNEGDGIALIKEKVSEASVEEARIKYKRAKEDYEAYETDKESYLLSLLKYSNLSTGSERDIAAAKLELETFRMDRESERLEKVMTEAEEKYVKISSEASRTMITAPISGFVGDLSFIREGDKLWNGYYFGSIIESESVLYEVQDPGGVLSYGMHVLLTDKGGTTFEGEVVSVNFGGDYEAFDHGLSYIKTYSDIPADDRFGLMASYETFNGGETIVLESGVYHKDSLGTYVYVLSDGVIRKTYFKSGREFNGKCVCLDGLTEGVTIVVI